MKYLAIWMLLCVIEACSENVSNTQANNRETVIFSNYINKTFQLNIPDERHYYILLPKLACMGCLSRRLPELNEFITIHNKIQFTCIYTNVEAFQRLMPKELKNMIPFYFDENGLLDRLNLDIANLTILKTEEREVKNILSIQTNDQRPLQKIIEVL